MAAGNTSLRFQVEKLVGTTRGNTTHTCVLERSRIGGTRRVCVQVQWAGGSISLFYFRHADGSWRLFPPERRRLEMGMDRKAA